VPGLAEFTQSFLDVHGTRLELQTCGQGRPILFLHSGEGLCGVGEALKRLSMLGRVIVPSHPGFGRSEFPNTISTVDDLSYFYLDVLDILSLDDTVLLGASFGGWIAAQMAIKCTQRIGKLVLIDSVGIKVGDRTTRDIVDMHALSGEELVNLTYVNPDKHKPNFAEFTDEDALIFARNKETFTYLAWRPYMHDPKLRGLLRRIQVPTLVLWGENDRIVSPQYGKAFSEEIPGSQFHLIENAGHYPFVEQPQAFHSQVAAFLGAGR
jgi:pimeloyl-ACP methyl ester carboxylesterase